MGKSTGKRDLNQEAQIGREIKAEVDRRLLEKQRKQENDGNK